MKRIPIIIITGFLALSCSKKTPEFVNSIPDNAIAVVSMHPMKIYTKAKLNSVKSIKEKVNNEIWSLILENPLSSGMMMNEYLYLFATMEDEAPLLGMVAGIREVGKFENLLSKIDEENELEFTEMGKYKYTRPDQEGIIAWNEEQMVVLASPDKEFETSFWTKRLDSMFSPVKEESIVSLVDFKEFQGKMKDVNMWISSEDLREVITKFVEIKTGNLPINLTNNYYHIYCDFANGVVNLTTETNLSEEVQKNIDEVLVFNPSLNTDLLKMAPGEELLLALALSTDLEKIQKLVEKINPPQLDEVGGKLEGITGIPAKTMLNAFTGDFTLSVNAVEGEAMVPVEVFIGLGVKSDEIQKLLLEQVKSMVPVEEQGDFFVIKLQGNEIYSGIINDNWILTNVKGYKDKVKNGKLEESLLDSRFADFADKSMGIFLNLDLTGYPEGIKGLLDQSTKQKVWIEQLTGSLNYIGISGGGNESLMTVKTNKPNENSLYTLLKITDPEK